MSGAGPATHPPTPYGGEESGTPRPVRPVCLRRSADGSSREGDGVSNPRPHSACRGRRVRHRVTEPRRRENRDWVTLGSDQHAGPEHRSRPKDIPNVPEKRRVARREATSPMSYRSGVPPFFSLRAAWRPGSESMGVGWRERIERGVEEVGVKACCVLERALTGDARPAGGSTTSRPRSNRSLEGSWRTTGRCRAYAVPRSPLCASGLCWERTAA